MTRYVLSVTVRVGFLNLAACYSCCLLPETCCEEFNVFLDRGVAVGTYDNKNWDFFMNSCMEETGGKACRGKRLQPGPIRKKTEVP